jgi:hypothetical protein
MSMGSFGWGEAGDRRHALYRPAGIWPRHVTFFLSNNLTKGIAMFVESLEGRQMFSASAPTATVAPPASATPALFEVEDYSFDIEQTLSIGSQSSGAGEGKVAFDSFHITRKVDVASPAFFKVA